jgi:sulfoxide reductase heme-binding subunit YedZ
VNNNYTDPGQHLFWIASRSLGVVALIFVAVSVGLGLAMATGAIRGPGVKARVNQLHEAVALTGLLAIAGHGVALLGDSYLRPGITGIAIPFVMAHQPVWTGVGIIGGWLATILGLSFYVRRRIGTRLWRKLHRLTVLVYFMAVVHAIGAGTDSGTPWLVLILVATALPVVVLTAIRFLPTDEPREKRPRRRIPLPSEQF